MEPSCLLSIFVLRVQKCFRHGCVLNHIRTEFIVLHFKMQNFFVFRDGSLVVYGSLRLVRIQSIRVKNLLIVDVHLIIGKTLSPRFCLHK